MPTVLWIAAGSAAGGVLRYLATLGFDRLLGVSFPWGTLFVNALGCALIGFVNGLGVEARLIPDEIRLPLTVGILGGFTTFSSLGWESFRLLEAGRFAPALLNLVGSLVLGILLVWWGTVLARHVYAAG